MTDEEKKAAALDRIAMFHELASRMLPVLEDYILPGFHVNIVVAKPGVPEVTMAIGHTKPADLLAGAQFLVEHAEDLCVMLEARGETKQ